jgi:hypothetical protein
MKTSVVVHVVRVAGPDRDRSAELTVLATAFLARIATVPQTVSEAEVN